MSNYNKVLLMGRVTRDPELRYTPQGVPVLELGLAINREYVVGNERRKEATFLDVTFWRRQAEVVSQYFKKGQPIFVEGRLALDSWETPDGQKRSKLRVIADNFEFISPRGESEGVAHSAGGVGGGPPPPSYRRKAESDEASRGGQGARPGSRESQSRPAPAMPEPFEEIPEEEPPPSGPLGLEDKDVPF